MSRQQQIENEIQQLLEALVDDCQSLRRGLMAELDMLVKKTWPPSLAKQAGKSAHTIILERMLMASKMRDKLDREWGGV